MAPGLRERKRAALERDLASAALSLVAERGFAMVTVDDIVARTGVSRRTFSNYFACKEDAVAAVVLHRASDALESWRAEPAEAAGGLVPVVRSLLMHQMRSGTFVTMAAVSALAREHHQLVPYLREAQWALWSSAGARIIDELGETDATRRVELTALMGAVFGVVTTSFLAGPAGDRLEPLEGPRHLEHILARLEHGFSP
jgi:AcrR family transcriptional regulator